MRTIALRVLANVAVLTVLASPTRTQDEAHYQELPNFHEVNDSLYRGGQPKSGGMEILKRLGIKTIINLRDDDTRAREEEAGARMAGLQYFNFPFARWRRPDDKEVERVLSVINNPANQPVFIHCKQGADRTGVVIAVYRITRDGWTGRRARAEAKRYGMKPWQLKMKKYIDDFYQLQTAVAPRPKP